ncbi:MAG: zf-HC2 domain-containing protein [Elusimicrobiota bacterium]
MSFFRCWSVRNILDLYVDDRLTAGAARRVKTHLKECEECRAEHEALMPVVRSGEINIEVPAGLTESILKKLREESAPAEAPLELREALRLSPAQACSLVYCALLLSAHALPGGQPSQAHSGEAARVLEAQR